MALAHGTIDDADDLVDMLRAVHNESPRLSRHPFDQSQAEISVVGMLSQDDRLVLVTRKGGEAVGCMGAILAPQLTSKAIVATELLLYVKPAYRGSRAALLMVRAFEEWAHPYDTFVGSSLGIDDTAVHGFYKRLGYELSGMSLLKKGTG